MAPNQSLAASQGGYTTFDKTVEVQTGRRSRVKAAFAAAGLALVVVAAYTTFASRGSTSAGTPVVDVVEIEAVADVVEVEAVAEVESGSVCWTMTVIGEGCNQNPRCGCGTTSVTTPSGEVERRHCDTGYYGRGTLILTLAENSDGSYGVQQNLWIIYNDMANFVNQFNSIPDGYIIAMGTVDEPFDQWASYGSTITSLFAASGMSGMPTSPEYRASFAAFGVKNCLSSATGCPDWTRLSYSSRYSSNSQETQEVCGCTSCPYTYTNDARYAHVSEYSYGTVASSHSYCNAGSINSATGSGYFSYITMNCGCGAWEWTASCSDVSCPANSYGTNVRSGCTCNTDYVGTIATAWSSSGYSGSCTYDACPAGTTGAWSSGCFCPEGQYGDYQGTRQVTSHSGYCTQTPAPANAYWDTSANKAFCSSGYQVTGQSNGLRELTNGVGIVIGTCFATPCSYATSFSTNGAQYIKDGCSPSYGYGGSISVSDSAPGYSGSYSLLSCPANSDGTNLGEGQLDTAESSRSYSTVWSGNAIGTGHAASTIDSSQGWSSQTNAVGQYMTIDIGSAMTVTGVAMQPRVGTNYQRVLTVKLETSTDGSSFTGDNTVYTANTLSQAASTVVDVKLNTPVSARYVRILPQTWSQHMSMRADVVTGGCTCDAGYVGTIGWSNGAVTGSCAAVPCPVYSSGSNVPQGCTCNAGYSGAVTAQVSSTGYTSTCTFVACPDNTSGNSVVDGCPCHAGYANNNGNTVTGTSSSPFFTPADGCLDINECDPEPCAVQENGQPAQCDNNVNAFYCHCDPNHYGSTCAETHVDCTADRNTELCSFGACFEVVRTVEGDAAYGCTCDAGYYSMPSDVACDQPVNCPAHSSGTNVALGCTCDVGYSGGLNVVGARDNVIVATTTSPYYTGVCQPDPCVNDPSVEYMDAAASACEDTISGATCAITCNYGFAPSSVATCSTGQWNSPTCEVTNTAGALRYCNLYPDLMNAFCGGSTCTSRTHARSCQNHYNNHGNGEGRDENGLRVTGMPWGAPNAMHPCTSDPVISNLDGSLTQCDAPSTASNTECTITCEAGFVPVKEHEATVLDTPEASRSYSSVWSNNAIGSGHAMSRLNSGQAWSTSGKPAGSYMTIDLGETKVVTGVVTQPRTGNTNSQRVTAYTVSCSIDGTTYVQDDTVYSGNQQGESASTMVTNSLTTALSCRYVRLTVVSYYGHMSMRADVMTGGAVSGTPGHQDFADYVDASIADGGAQAKCIGNSWTNDAVDTRYCAAFVCPDWVTSDDWAPVLSSSGSQVQSGCTCHSRLEGVITATQTPPYFTQTCAPKDCTVPAIELGRVPEKAASVGGWAGSDCGAIGGGKSDVKHGTICTITPNYGWTCTSPGRCIAEQFEQAAGCTPNNCVVPTFADAPVEPGSFGEGIESWNNNECRSGASVVHETVCEITPEFGYTCVSGKECYAQVFDNEAKCETYECTRPSDEVMTTKHGKTYNRLDAYVFNEADLRAAHRYWDTTVTCAPGFVGSPQVSVCDGGPDSQYYITGCNIDTDGDGVADDDEQCENDSAKTLAGICGCLEVDYDADTGLVNCATVPGLGLAGIEDNQYYTAVTKSWVRKEKQNWKQPVVGVDHSTTAGSTSWLVAAKTWQEDNMYGAMEDNYAFSQSPSTGKIFTATFVITESIMAFEAGLGSDTATVTLMTVAEDGTFTRVRKQVTATGPVIEYFWDVSGMAQESAMVVVENPTDGQIMYFNHLRMFHSEQGCIAECMDIVRSEHMNGIAFNMEDESHSMYVPVNTDNFKADTQQLYCRDTMTGRLSAGAAPGTPFAGGLPEGMKYDNLDIVSRLPSCLMIRIIDDNTVEIAVTADSRRFQYTTRYAPEGIESNSLHCVYPTKQPRCLDYFGILMNLKRASMFCEDVAPSVVCVETALAAKCPLSADVLCGKEKMDRDLLSCCDKDGNHPNNGCLNRRRLGNAIKVSDDLTLDADTAEACARSCLKQPDDITCLAWRIDDFSNECKLARECHLQNDPEVANLELSKFEWNLVTPESNPFEGRQVGPKGLAH